MTEQEMIEKIIRPNGIDLLIPPWDQIKSANEEVINYIWFNYYEAGVFFCEKDKEINSFQHQKDYIRALLQPIPSFSTAMQFLEKGAVLTSTDDSHIKRETWGSFYVLRTYGYYENKWLDLFEERPSSGTELLFSYFIQSLIENNQKLIYTPWINRENGETIQEIKDFCDEILKG